MKAISPDNPVLSTINKIVDIMWVSLLWCIVCLPALFGLFFGLNFLADEQIYLLLMAMFPICNERQDGGSIPVRCPEMCRVQDAGNLLQIWTGTQILLGLSSCRNPKRADGLPGD